MCQLERDQGFDHVVFFGLHQLEAPLDIVEAERMRGHRGGIDSPGAEDRKDPLHSVVAAWAESGVN